MGVPESGLEAAGPAAAETLLTAFRTIKDAERARHATVLDYWLSIRGDKEFPPLHDLDPLEISDAGPSSILFELIGGGQDAEIRHLGDMLAGHVAVERLIDAPSPSLLASIARKLPIVAISREFLAFEDSFSTASGVTRCWVTLLPLSSCGSWVDYVYAFVSIDGSSAGTEAAPGTGDQPAPDAPDDAGVTAEAAEVPQGRPDVEPDVEPEASGEAPAAEPEKPEEPEEQEEVAQASDLPKPAEAEEPAQPASSAEPVEALGAEGDAEPELAEHAVTETETAPEKPGPGFSRLIEGIANLAGFYGQGIKAEAEVRLDVPAAEPAPEEGSAAPDPAEAETAIDDGAIPVPPVETETRGAGEAPEAPEETPAMDEPVAADDEPTDPPVSAEPEPREPEPEPEPVVTQLDPAPEKTVPPAGGAHATEDTLENKLSEVRAKADEARQAQLRATEALHEGLSAAYDFALDAETSPEDYLRLVEAQGMKIQLRAPMAPVARLAFDGVCDAGTIKQFEAVLAWALKEELPRGSLLERIQGAGGISELLNGN